MSNNHFGKILKELRQEKELSQTNLAKKLDYGNSIISAWELGLKRPSIDALIAIALFFDVTIDYLAGLEDELGNKVRPKIL